MLIITTIMIIITGINDENNNNNNNHGMVVEINNILRLRYAERGRRSRWYILFGVGCVCVCEGFIVLPIGEY